MNFNEIINIVLSGKVITAVKYVSPQLVIRATRKRYEKKILKGGRAEVTLTVGRPNYLERDFIKACKKAKEPFPIKKIQIKPYTQPKKK